MQVIANQLVPNTHGRNNQVSFNALHVNSDIIGMSQEQRAIIGDAAAKLRELAKGDEVIIGKGGYVGQVSVSAIRELKPELKIPVIIEDSFSLIKATPEDFIAFTKQVQETLATKIKSYIEVINGSDTEKLCNTTADFNWSFKNAAEMKNQLPEMDKNFKKVFVEASDSKLSALTEKYKTEADKIQEVKDFYKQVTE